MFVAACESGNLIIAKCLFACFKNCIDLVHHITAFRQSCVHGHLLVAQWMWDVSDVPFDISINHNILFDLTCTRGHLSVAQWLLTILGQDILADIDMVFKHVCGQGTSRVAQWLLSIFRQHIDLAVGFKEACAWGQLHVAQWLLDYVIHRVSPLNNFDIQVYDDAFTTARARRYLPVVRWLVSLNSDRYTIHGHIRTEAEIIALQVKRRNQSRTFVLGLSCNDAIDKQNILYALPPDVTRYMCSNFL